MRVLSHLWRQRARPPANFISVGSEFYPQLGEHYDRQTLAWVMGKA